MTPGQKIHPAIRLAYLVGAAVVVALAIALLIYLHGRGNPPAVQPHPFLSPVAKQGARMFPISSMPIGTVQSIDAVAVQPRVTGAIVEVEFTPGQDVKQGQELFLIDPRPYEAALSQARAQLAHDEGLLGEAQMDLKRYQNLAEQNAIAKQQAQDQAYVVEQDKGTVDLDQANVETAELNLQYCHVASPIDGRAGALLVDLGNLVGPQSAGQSTSDTNTGTTTTGGQTPVRNTLVSITQLQPIYVDFNVPQTSTRRDQRQSGHRRA